MLIDVSFFVSGPRQIMNALSNGMPNANNMAVNNTINAYIKYYQEDFLCGMLGQSLGIVIDDYIQSKDKGGEINDEYEDLCDRLKESFADYVFFYILRNVNREVTISGLVKLKTVNSYLSPLDKGVEVWNEMVRRNIAFNKYASLKGIVVDRNFITPINSFNI